MRKIKITEKNLPIAFEPAHADPARVAALTSEEKQAIIDKANLLIEQYYAEHPGKFEKD